ncbi:MAG: DUF3501 family protein [Pseudomonadales bacterium]|nr:DUF3501 family protein [Pseudomonadales bacterium]
MPSLNRNDLWSLEQYAERRAAFRSEVLAHKKNRKVLLGDNIQLMFEDRLTIQYQIQEMLRIEKIFEAASIEEELTAYNPLIPEGNNWKCTMLIQYEDIDERKKQLAALVGVEDKVWLQVGDNEQIFAIADEDMERSNEQKTAAVHFLRFQFQAIHCEQVLAGAAIKFGVAHNAYSEAPTIINEATRLTLCNDLDH